MKDFKKLAIFWRNEIFSQNLIPIYERAQKENKPLYIVVGAYHAEDLQARLKNTLKKAPISITKSNK
jgi:pheromone shutdown protein TraB